MIIWGSGADVINLGAFETKRCETCEKDRPFNVMLQYRYWGFYWIFNFVREKKYLLLCDICQRGWELETNKIEPTLEKVPIPFMRRYGLLLLLGTVGLLIMLGAVGKI